MRELYLGLISGTSMDGVDAVLAEISDSLCQIQRAQTTAFPSSLAERLRRLVEVPQTSLADLGALDHALGRFFAACSLELIEKSGFKTTDITAIGHHGQTVFHEPRGSEPFSMQIGDPNIVAATTGITTVADFRRLDMAHGGQGAPLMPAFHAWRFRAPEETRVVLNIGGIANTTVLDRSHAPTGLDTGPGNTLLDLWVRRCRNQAYDRDGGWAASGNVNAALLDSFLDEPFFAAPAPKSTGRELFNMDWIDRHLAAVGRPADADVQATLAELTAATIATAIARSVERCQRIIVCGGGAHNVDLMARLTRLTHSNVESSAAFQIPPDWVEGAGFAWLARARLKRIAGNLPSVTGARRPAILGGVYWGGTP